MGDYRRQFHLNYAEATFILMSETPLRHLHMPGCTRHWQIQTHEPRHVQYVQAKTGLIYEF